MEMNEPPLAQSIEFPMTAKELRKMLIMYRIERAHLKRIKDEIAELRCYHWSDYQREGEVLMRLSNIQKKIEQEGFFFFEERYSYYTLDTLVNSEQQQEEGE